MALTDTSVTTLIMNWRPTEAESDVEKYKKSVSEVKIFPLSSCNKTTHYALHNIILQAQKLIKAIERRKLYRLIASERFPRCPEDTKPVLPVLYMYTYHSCVKIAELEVSNCLWFFCRRVLARMK